MTYIRDTCILAYRRTIWGTAGAHEATDNPSDESPGIKELCACVGSLSQLLRAGLVVAPHQHRSKDNEHNDDGYANEYRIDWHGWTPVMEQ
jgi:hypothetical protein